MDDKFVPNKTDDDEFVFDKKYYELLFGYLSQIYIDMDSMIEEGVRMNEDADNMVYKRGIVQVIKLIYEQFCRDNSECQVCNLFGKISSVYLYKVRIG